MSPGRDVKTPEYEESTTDEFEVLSLRHWHNALLAARQIDEVSNLAADMGSVQGMIRLMATHYRAPLNIGSEELVTVDRLMDMGCEIVGEKPAYGSRAGEAARSGGTEQQKLTTQNGARVGPATPLESGLEIIYRWIEQALERAGRLALPILSMHEAAARTLPRAKVLGVGIHVI